MAFTLTPLRKGGQDCSFFIDIVQRRLESLDTPTLNSLVHRLHNPERQIPLEHLFALRGCWLVNERNLVPVDVYDIINACVEQDVRGNAHLVSPFVPE